MGRLTARVGVLVFLAECGLMAGVAVAQVGSGLGLRLSVRDWPVSDVLYKLMSDSGKLIVMADTTDKKISLQLDGQSLDEALNIIAAESGLSVSRKGDIYVIGSADRPSAASPAPVDLSAAAVGPPVIIPPPPPAAGAEVGSHPGVVGQVRWEKINLRFADVLQVCAYFGYPVLQGGGQPWIPGAAAPSPGGYGAGEQPGREAAGTTNNPYSPLAGGYHQRPGGGLGGGQFGGGGLYGGGQYGGGGLYGGGQYGGGGLYGGGQYGGGGLYGGGQYGGGLYGGGLYGGGAGAGAAAELPSTIIGFPPENSLLVRGTQEQIDRLREFLTLIDVEPIQLEIIVQFVEVDASASDQFGVNWSTFGSATTEITLGTTAPTGIGVNAIRYAKGDFFIRLAGLISKRRAKVVNSPRVICKNNPLIPPSVSATSTQIAWVPSTSYSQFGNPVVIYTPVPIDIPTVLTVFPRVNGDGSINIRMNPVFTEFVGFSPPSPSGGSGVPLTVTRTASADIRVANGDTVAIAGLTRRNDTNSWIDLPLLKDLPIIGSLFRTKNVSREEVELVILVTPRVIHTPESML